MALESAVAPTSLYEPVFSDGEDSFSVMDQLRDKTSEESWISDMMFRDTVRALSPRERRIIALRYLGGKTQTEVAKEIGISQAQVSRLEKGALCPDTGADFQLLSIATPAFRVKTERGRFVVLGCKSDLESLVQSFQGGILVLLADQQRDVQVAGRDQHDLDIGTGQGSQCAAATPQLVTISSPKRLILL